MNVLRTGNSDLISVDYGDILKKILEVLSNRQTKNPFSITRDRNRLLIDIDSIATQLSSLPIENPLGASTQGVRAATINFSPGFEERFPKQILQLKDCLQQLLDSAVRKSEANLSVEDFVASLVTNLEEFRGSTSKLDLTYPFGSYQGLQKQRLSFQQKSSGSQELLKLHKLTITVRNTSNFQTQLKEGLKNYLNTQFAGADESDREDLDYILEDLEKDPKSDFFRLQEIVDTETIGRLKKQAQINYLEFLLDNIKTNASSTNAEAAIYLQDLIRRLKLIEQYIGDLEKGDGHYQVNYAGASVNYRDFFSRAEAFDKLPIIPKIEGYLGETKEEEKGELQFIFGLKLKFNNPVQAYGGKTVFDYYLNLLDPDSEEHKAEIADNSKRESFARKVLGIVFLYYFVFASSNPVEEGYTPDSDLKYNPILTFEEKALNKLRESDDEKKKALFRAIKKGLEKYNIPSKLDLLRERLIKLLKCKMNFPVREYPLHIVVKKSILEQDINNILNQSTFFKSVLRGNPKEVLKYISIRGANAEANSLCTLPASITIKDIHYFSTDDRQTFGMEYDITRVKALPMLLLPDEKQCKSIYAKSLKQRRLIVFPYNQKRDNWDTQSQFIFKFTYSLLTYTCLKILLAKQKRLFIPILRFHLSNKEEEKPVEKFMVSLSKVLSHLLNEEHRSNAQGIDIRDLQSKGRYKIPNVLSSLYSVLPKRFQLTDSSPIPQLKKLAIVIVSSRESDATWRGSDKISNLMGEVIGITCQDGVVRLQLLKTFSGNYEQQKIFKEPTVIIDEVDEAYRRGFKHFVYIAKAPYSSTLHMTHKQDSDELFFMSKDIIRALKAEHDDIKIYPMFFDKYYVVKLPSKLRASSLYIQDTSELTSLVEDPSKQSVVFFNLFNGTTIGRKEERNYNGVISYATLLNIYKDILDDEDIRTGLIYDTKLKNDILQYLTLFHFSRYEKAKSISLKLDPYDNLIGDDSIGKLSLFNLMRGRGGFNCLAFLTKVREVLNVK